VPKLTAAERTQVQNLVANLYIKNIPESMILDEIRRQTGKTISRVSLFYIKQRIKKESYKWYSQLRKDNFEFIHEFRQRIREINDLQEKHYLIMNSDKEPTYIKQTSMAELHKLTITLSNLYDIAPYIVSNLGANTNNNGNPISIKSEDKEEEIIV
jgi:hypothetical protein